MAPKGYNLTKGGDGISEPTEEILRVNREKHLGYKMPEAQKLKISNSEKGRIVSEATKEKLRIANKGKQPHINARIASSKRHKNTHWYNDGSLEYMLHDNDLLIKEKDLVKGRIKNPFPSSIGIKRSDGYKQKMRAKKVNSSWYHNDIKEIMVAAGESAPEGFIKGRLKKVKD